MTAVDPDDRLHRFKRLRKMLSVVPYRYGAAVLAVLTRNPVVQASAGKHRQRLLEFMREHGIADSPREPFARYLTCNYLAAWRLLALAKCDDEEFARWVTVEGEEHFSALREAGRAVILCNSHYGSGKAVLLALIRQGHVIHSLDRQDVFSFFGVRARGRIASINLGDREQSFMLKQVALARRALNEGGILHIAGDGLRGLSGKAIPFLGRGRRFPASVAELALVTGAAVVPVFGTLDASGRIRLEILPPLSMPQIGLSREESVGHIISQYRDLLESRWLADPGAIFKSELVTWAGLPRLTQKMPSLGEG